MALSVPLSALMTSCRERAGMENSTFITDPELVRLINASTRKLYNLLISSRGQDYYRASFTFNTTNATQEYVLPSDFFQLLSVDALLGGIRLTIHNYMEEERNQYGIPYAWGAGLPLYYRLQASNIRFIPMPTGIYAITLNYIPAPITLVAPSDTVDGFAGWEDFLIWDTVAAMLAKEESDPSFALGQREMVRADIMALAPSRDAGQPERVQDVVSNQFGNGFGPWWSS